MKEVLGRFWGLYLFLRTGFIWKKELTASNVEFALHLAGIPDYILCVDEGKLVIKVGLWNTSKYFKHS